jgi:hypothetical protein
MIFIRDKLTYDEVRFRFEKEGYTLLSTEYKNAKGNLNLLCPYDHEWTTNISNFDFGRRCSICSKRKKYALKEVKNIFIKQGYLVQDSIYMNGKTPIKVKCPIGHEVEINLNNFNNGRRCSVCRRRDAIDTRMKRLEMKVKGKEGLSRYKVGMADISRLSSDSAEQVKPEWLEKLDDMRKNLKPAKRRNYRE